MRLSWLAILMCLLVLVGNVEAANYPQGPDQIAFDRSVVPGSILWVGHMTLLRATIAALQHVNPRQLVEHGKVPTGTRFWTGTAAFFEPDPKLRVKVLAKTNEFTIDVPEEPVTPDSWNPARRIAKVQVIAASISFWDSNGNDELHVSKAIGKIGYMILDDLAFPGHKWPSD